MVQLISDEFLFGRKRGRLGKLREAAHSSKIPRTRAQFMSLEGVRRNNRLDQCPQPGELPGKDTGAW